jgi:alpha-L-arabinofuranosidase
MTRNHSRGFGSVAVLSTLLALAACGGDDGGRDTPAAAGEAGNEQTASGASGGASSGGQPGAGESSTGPSAGSPEAGAGGGQSGSTGAAGAAGASATSGNAGASGAGGTSGNAGVSGAGGTAGAAAGAGGSAEWPTLQGPTLEVTDTVVTAGVQHFGINLGSDNYWDSVLNRNRIKNGGFEGVMYRHIARGPGGDAQSLYDWNDYTYAPSADDEELSDRTWLDIATGANAWVLAGDRAWQSEVIDRVEHAVMPGRESDGERLRFVFADSGPEVGASGGATLDEVGLLLEKVEPAGFVGQHGGPLWTFASSGARITTAGTDLPPGTTGSAVAVIEAPGSETAKLMYPLLPADLVDPNGTWRISFWAKGDGTLSIGYGPWGDPRDPSPVALSGEWQYFEDLAMMVSDYADDSLNLHLSVTGGTVMLDDVAAYLEGDTNPTTFRDDLVELLGQLEPGSLRYLHMGGSSVDNLLGRDHERMAFDFHRNVPPDSALPWPPHPNTNGGAEIHPYGMHEFLELCAQLGAQPWLCVPGTSFPAEMENLMEYLAGPASSPYGQIRADRGQAQPWTEVFDQIHIEMGNEAWNWAEAYAYGGWNGPEYWSALFTAAKEKLSEYAGANAQVRFHIGAQNYNTWLGAQLVEQHGAAADAYAIAPYVIHEMNDEQAAFDDEQLFSWAFAWVWYLNTGGPMQANWDMIQDSVNPNLEISVYEVNHHITGGSAPTEPRNRIVTSIGGALNILNHMLLMVERYDVRVQNFFSLFQREYDGVGLWGSVLSARPDDPRYRPTFQALMLANQVLEGDLVAVTRSGEDPTWHESLDYDGTAVEVDVPFVHAYATRNGTVRGLILLNLHRTDALSVQLELAAEPSGAATRWTLEAASVAANNELDHAPEVSIQEASVTGFADGHTVDLPPHSLTVLRWEQ